MVKNILEIFNKNTLKGDTFTKFTDYLGPYQNFHGIKTMHYINLRILKGYFGLNFKTVNRYYQTFESEANYNVKSLLRTYAQGIITTVNIKIIS